MVAEPCTIQTIKVPNHNRVPTLAPTSELASQIDTCMWAPGGEGWDPRSHHARARLACPLGNAKDALDTIA